MSKSTPDHLQLPDNVGDQTGVLEVGIGLTHTHVRFEHKKRGLDMVCTENLQ